VKGIGKGDPNLAMIFNSDVHSHSSGGETALEQAFILHKLGTWAENIKGADSQTAKLPDKQTTR
jgi:hypothetical protein